MENGNLRKGHCLILPYPLQGHVNPLLQFSKRLRFKGAQITLVHTKSFINRIKDSSATSLFPSETISDGFDEGGVQQAGNFQLYFSRFQEVGSRTLGELIEKLRDSGSPVDCVVYDAFLPWVLDVAKKYGVAGAVFFTQSCAVGDIYYHVCKGVVKLPLDDHRRYYEIPGLPVLERSDFPSFVTAPEIYPAAREMVINQFSNVDKADWVLFNTLYKLEQEVIDWMSKLWPAIRPVGPTVPSMYLDKRLQDDNDYGMNIFKPMGDTCRKWLEQRANKSVVYVSFGSLAALNSEAMKELAWGLKMSNKYFLWVVRSSEESKLPENFVEENSEKGLIVSWCPQLEVLSNESTGCFVTHCGWNSTLEALSLGVPLVAMPQWTDQTTNAKFVEDVWEIGIKAGADGNGIVRKEMIDKCIKEVMEGKRGEKIKENARKWKEWTLEAAHEGGSSDKNIDEFVSKCKLGPYPKS
ncbi:OLC1v1030615C1 [Oldenlandia corymbosa var. corymbosa]|uniref:Glycosyltransferase n=1 Tax=Oldenlandia corymbosa var. corymbosa TaxID=529605 RepID=A0AAV1CIE8_OLDCO|nr:OLC1v1030615C1 [Oldenlandia corymbosa var. corymbosa]